MNIYAVQNHNHKITNFLWIFTSKPGSLPNTFPNIPTENSLVSLPFETRSRVFIATGWMEIVPQLIKVDLTILPTKGQLQLLDISHVFFWDKKNGPEVDIWKRVLVFWFDNFWQPKIGQIGGNTWKDRTIYMIQPLQILLWMQLINSNCGSKRSLVNSWQILMSNPWRGLRVPDFDRRHRRFASLRSHLGEVVWTKGRQMSRGFWNWTWLHL